MIASEETSMLPASGVGQYGCTSGRSEGRFNFSNRFSVIFGCFCCNNEVFYTAMLVTYYWGRNTERPRYEGEVRIACTYIYKLCSSLFKLSSPITN